MNLSYNQYMSVVNSRGVCVCPSCGKFRKVSDFPEQPAHESISNIEGTIVAHVPAIPICAACFVKDNIK